MGQIEKVRCHVLGCSPPKPSIMPEQCFLAISYFDFCGGLEECKVLVVTWERHALPWFRIISPVVPKQPLMEGSPKALKVVNIVATKVFRSACYVPFD
jgi:hypothetical protein